jgi:hypothetical protein
MKGREARAPRWLWAGAGLLVALLAWQLVAELIEPNVLLVLEPRAPYLEAPTVAGTTLRLYSDRRPHVGKISGLQKGLVWLRKGRLLVEEGYGFGTPIVEYEGQAYLARHAEIGRSAIPGGVRLVKRYQMDTIDTPIRFLRRKYRPVPSIGAITFRYEVRPGGAIDVWVDFSDLEVSWTRVYLMNEQGARRFTRYDDARGTHLEGDEVGIWESVAEFAGRACWSSAETALRFCVEPLGEGTQPPAVVYYGRERYNQYNWRGIYYLAWAGVDLALDAPQSNYGYRITLEAQ